MYNSIRPGQPWYDTDGNLIQAHGGSVLYHEGTFYWFGENKDNWDFQKHIWHNGVQCYSSKDLYNWKNEGTILPVSDDLKNPMHPERIMDRPHILYNKRTGKFVMWVKFAGTEDDFDAWQIQYMGVYVSEDITKPFEFVHTIRPLGMETGDFDLWADPRDGKGYFFADRVHTEVVIADLTDDYLNVTGNYSSHFPHTAPPLAREAPCFFKRKDRYYIISSGTTGYHPNPTEAARAELMHGPYEVTGELCMEDIKHTSFDCQFSSVFQHPFRKDLYIGIGDRWMNKTEVIEGEEIANTKEAGYIWLPIRFHGDVPYAVWEDEWKIEEFPENMHEKEWWE